MKKTSPLSLLVLLCAAVILSVSTVAAQPHEIAAVTQEVVFLLDTSNSMNALETNAAVQTVCLMAHCLISDCASGFVSFNTEIQSTAALSNDHYALDQAARGTKFTGYSNTGAGLKEALSLFTKKPDVSRHVILVSDGEIIMATEKETQSSVAVFQEAAAQADADGIQIHTIMIGIEGAADQVLFASEKTGGKVYWANGKTQMLDAAQKILFGDMKIRQSMVASGGAQTGRLNLTLPDTAMSHAKILLTTDFPLYNVTAAANAADVRVITDEQYAVVELDAPTQTGVSVAFDAISSGEIRARVIPEYEVRLEVDVTYPEAALSATNSQPQAEPAVLRITANTQTGNLWKGSTFDGKKVPLTVNGQVYEALIENGEAQVEYLGQETAEYNIEADFSAFEGNFLSISSAHGYSARPVVAIPEPTIDYRPLIVVLGCLVFALAAVLVKGRRGAVSRQPQNYTGVSPHEKLPSGHFCGKLNIYVTHLPDDQDVPPQTFNLYRENRDKLRLHYILSACGISLGETDARGICLSPGNDGLLNITNDSNSTVLRNRDLMMKGKSFEVQFEQKVTITFDNDSEIVLHYKNVKPGERV